MLRTIGGKGEKMQALQGFQEKGHRQILEKLPGHIPGLQSENNGRGDGRCLQEMHREHGPHDKEIGIRPTGTDGILEGYK